MGFLESIYKNSAQSRNYLQWENFPPGPLSGTTIACSYFASRVGRATSAIRRWFHPNVEAGQEEFFEENLRFSGARRQSSSYYGFDARKANRNGGVVFQIEPHPISLRRILQQEIEFQPTWASSLQSESPLRLRKESFERGVREIARATHYLTASSFTKDTLIENGVLPDAIRVVPYGIDSSCFCPDPNKSVTRTRRLRLLFVGQVSQRNGMQYLLDALHLLANKNIDLMVCGDVGNYANVFKAYRSQVELRPPGNTQDLLRAYQQADLLVYPSIADGFGHALLESLACGLPILSTTHTAAPDLIEDHVQGFIVEPRRADMLADRIQWAYSHRAELAQMGERARERAEFFTWTQFRSAATIAVNEFLRDHESTSEQGVA